jgi:Zn finger protein HypA/HybF involved in hydrogenase expression
MKDLKITKGELLPCPFCGGKAEKIFIGNDYTKKRSVHIKCTVCHTEQRTGAIVRSHQWCDYTATEKWNLRSVPSELLRQRDELREALAEQKRLYFNLFDEEIRCMYCEAEISRGSAIILCKECAENTEL